MTPTSSQGLLGVGHISSINPPGLKQVTLMVPRHPPSLLCAEWVLPQGGLSPMRGYRTEGVGETGWLLLRGEQRTPLS